jgi:DNA-binding PadR family transcriptional regulator
MSPATRHDEWPPLRPNDFYILFTLLDGPLHGYRLSRAIETATAGKVRLEAANLQRTVQKLIREGLVEVARRRPHPSADDARRRYYAITKRGREAVAADAARMRDLARAAEARKLISKPRRAI